MPQVLRVVQCYKCESFQVDIEKQSNKWKCKLCGERQSLKQVFHSGTGVDCRKLVQELNQKRFKRDVTLNSKLEQLALVADGNITQTNYEAQSNTAIPSSSKWHQFIENAHKSTSNDNSTDEEECSISPPKKKVKLLADENDETKTFHLIESTLAKKPQKRFLFDASGDIDNSLTKYVKLNNLSRSANAQNESSENKWLKYVDKNLENSLEMLERKKPKRHDVQDEPKIEVEVCRSIFDDSQANKNNNWKFHTEWDSFSDLSQTSCNENELVDIVDDQFEEFDNITEESLSTHTQQNKQSEMFGSSNKDLDSIFKL